MAQFVEPRVRLVGYPNVNFDEMWDYLNSVDDRATQWLYNVSMSSSAEVLAEFMGRLCYKSWAPGINPNVTKVRTSSLDYLQNTISKGHGSILEHGMFNFVFQNVSRTMTHELVRHRAGVAVSQESLRFVRLTDIDVVAPPEHQTPEFLTMVEQLEDYQKNQAEKFGLDQEGVPFSYKKEVTSALRRLAPIGLATHIGWSANLRTLRHVITMRTDRHAEWEIRFVFDRVAQIMKQTTPLVFDDFEAEELEDGTHEWKTKT